MLEKIVTVVLYSCFFPHELKITSVLPSKKQINKPRPVSEADMEAIFRKAREEQETTDQAFEEEQKALASLKIDESSESATKPVKKSRRTSTKASGSSKKENIGLVPGKTVKVLSGTFAGFDGDVKKFNRKSKKVIFCH